MTQVHPQLHPKSENQIPEFPHPSTPRASGMDSALTPAASGLLGAIERGEHDLAMALVHRNWGELYYGLEPAQLREALEQLPLEPLLAHPGSLLLARIAQLSDDWSLPLPDGPDRAVVQMLNLAHHLRPVDALAEIDTHDPDLLTTLAGVGDASGGRRSARIAQVAEVALMCGHHARARQLLRDTTRITAPVRHPYLGRRVRALLALAHALDAEHEPARQWLAQAEHLPRSGSWAEEHTDSFLGLAQLVIAVDRADVATTRTLLADRPSPRDHHELWPLAVWVHAHAHLLLRSPHLAFSMLEESAHLLRDTPGDQGWPGMVAALVPVRMALSTGALDVAATLLRDVEEAARFTMLGALVDYTLGDVESALRLAREARARSHAVPRALMEAVALMAACHHARGDAEARDEALDDLVRFAAVTDVYVVIVEAPSPLRPLLLERDLPDRVKDLLSGPAAPPSPAPLLESPLTPAEAEVLRQLAVGLSRGEIARELHLSENTVKTHLRNLYAKLGVSTRQQAVDRALELRSFLAHHDH